MSYIYQTIINATDTTSTTSIQYPQYNESQDLKIKPYNTYVLIEVLDDNSTIGKVIAIGDKVVKPLNIGDKIHYNRDGPYYELVSTPYNIPEDEDNPNQPDYAVIDFRSIMFIDKR